MPGSGSGSGPGSAPGLREDGQTDAPAQRRASPAEGAGPGPARCNQNGLINTHSLRVETREGVVSVYSAPQYQGHVVVNLPTQQVSCDGGLRCVGLGGGGGGVGGAGGHPQLLNPSALPQGVDARFRPNLIVCSESVLRAWGEGGLAGDCCETTFIEDLSPASSAATVTKDGLVFADGKFLDLSMEDAKIQTLSYDMDDDDDFQELEVSTVNTQTHSQTNKQTQQTLTDMRMPFCSGLWLCTAEHRCSQTDSVVFCSEFYKNSSVL